MAFINKGLKKLQNRGVDVSSAVINDPLLGKGLDSTLLPNGHLACPHDNCPWFHVNIIPLERNWKLECYCFKCGEVLNVIIPAKGVLEGESAGAFQCLVHQSAPAAVIVNDGTVCVGCQSCNQEVRFNEPEAPLIWTPH